MEMLKILRKCKLFHKKVTSKKCVPIFMIGPPFGGTLLPGPDITGSYSRSYGLLDTPVKIAQFKRLISYSRNAL